MTVAAQPKANPPRLPTRALADAEQPKSERLSSTRAMPIFVATLAAFVGASEVGKTRLTAHTALDVARGGRTVLVLDGEMSAGAWRRILVQLGADDDALAQIHYAEMSEHAANVELVRNTVAALGAVLIIWDSALSLISRTARSENDNAEVGRVFDRLREIIRDGPAGLIVDHAAAGAATMVSRGASAKFAALDISYGVRLAEGSIPGPLETWTSTITVEKDRHGLLPGRHDRTVSFIPLGSGNLEIDIVEDHGGTHRLSASNPVTVMVERLAALDPPPRSANDAYKRLGGTRTVVLNAYRDWTAQGGSGGSVSIETNHRTTSSRTGSNHRTTEDNVRPLWRGET